MHVRWKFAVAAAIVAASCGAERPEKIANEFAPELPAACPPDGFDDCFRQKMVSFQVSAVFSGVGTDPLAVGRAACDRPDADGCFLLGTLFELNDVSFQAVPESVRRSLRRSIKRDMVLAAQSFEKSCALGSAMGCASAADLIAPDDETLQHLSVEKQKLYFKYQRRSCEVGWLLSCSVFLESVLKISPDDWSDGKYAFFDAEQKVASIVCAAGDLYGCHRQGVAVMRMGYAEGGTQQQLEAGFQKLIGNCEAGFDESCALIRPYTNVGAKAQD